MSSSTSTSVSPGVPARRTWRNGMTVVVVLGVISITLALSYAMLRSQTTSVEIQSNLDRRAAARQAAYAGVSAAMRKMNDVSWQGIDVPIEQDLSDHQWFITSFETGDSALLPTDADYSEYPFRVTINAVGYAADPSHPDVRSTYKVRAVVQLIRKKLYNEPATWANVRNYTAYHWSGNAFNVEFPVRVEGPVYAQGPFMMSTDYPTDLTSRTRYYTDLAAMIPAGKGDHRPFNGPISTPHSKQYASTLSLLQSTLGCTVTNIGSSSAAPVTFPTDYCYQLFPGGKCYEMPVIQDVNGGTLANITLDADPLTNPLGVFYSRGTLVINSNVNVKGTIVVAGTSPDIQVLGKNVVIEGRTLPFLENGTTKYQFPVVIAKGDFLLFGSAGATIRGLVATWDEFAFQRGASTAKCDMLGRVVAFRMNLYGRSPWALTLTAWQTEYLNFVTQALLGGGNAIAHYPVWLQQTRSMNYQPLLTIKPGSADIVDRWHTWGQPVYVPADGDSGLRWNLVDWTDNPRAAN